VGRLSSVWADDGAAMLSIVECLVALGHTRIAHVAGFGVAAEMRVTVLIELSIVAFDDSTLTRVVYPALTALSRG
jgi:DNA-binding LacI/PurR family transcriptional regulator